LRLALTHLSENRLHRQDQHDRRCLGKPDSDYIECQIGAAAADHGWKVARPRGFKRREIVNARLMSLETKAAIAKLGLQIQVQSPQQYGAALADEVRLWKAAVDEAGVHLE
jgi:hypothetical protein